MAANKGEKAHMDQIEYDKSEDEHNVVVAAESSISTKNQSNGHSRKITDLDLQYEPRRKIAKLNKCIKLSFNRSYLSTNFTEQLGEQWRSNDKNDFVDAETKTSLYTVPYKICVLPALLEEPERSCKHLVHEMIHNVEWSRKQMDLYEFYQSTDLSNMSTCKLLTNFLALLRREVRPWLEKVTNLKLDYVSASCSMYTYGDYLLVHDDLLKDRQVAFIYYLSPWANALEWREDMGGCLEIFNSDEQCFPEFPVHRKITPKNNQFAFFKVGSRSFHQVGEVTNFDFPRLTINGWFHGASNNDITATDTLRPFTNLKFTKPLKEELQLEGLVNPIYLQPKIRASIQKRIENNSEIALNDFMCKAQYDRALQQLLSDEKLLWKRKGPANAHNYEVLQLSSVQGGALKDLCDFFQSHETFALLRDYTELDLAGPSAKQPKCCLELQRWTHGNYTVLGDGAMCDENTLDLIYYLNAAEGAGIITYLSPDAEDQKASGGDSSSASDGDDSAAENDEDDDDSLLLTITPADNVLNVVYRCEGTTKFTKYVSRNTPLEKGPVFVVSCSYKE